MYKLPYEQSYIIASLSPRAFIPFKSDGGVSPRDVEFEGFGLAGTAAAPGSFQPGWRVVVPQSDLRQLVAMFTGSLRLTQVQGSTFIPCQDIEGTQKTSRV